MFYFCSIKKCKQFNIDNFFEYDIMNCMIKDIVIESKKISRCLPKDWDLKGKRYPLLYYLEFSKYVESMYSHLLDIKKYYEKDFNEDNTYTIQEYIDLFNVITRKLTVLLATDDVIKKIGKFGFFSPKDSFCVTSVFDLQKLDKKAFKISEDGSVVGFNDEIYKKVEPLVKKIFMIEKMCSFTTRKFWAKEITDIKDFCVNKPYKILARVVFPDNWRATKEEKEVRNYYKNKIYTSASIIDEKHTNNLFMYYDWKHEKAAILILSYDENNFVCANYFDSMSEEYINNKNPLFQPTEHSDVFKVDETTIDDRKHEFYSNATEIATPKGILNNIMECSEVNLKNPKVVGVIAPNALSINFAKKEAEKRNVPVFYTRIH